MEKWQLAFLIGFVVGIPVGAMALIFWQSGSDLRRRERIERIKKTWSKDDPRHNSNDIDWDKE